MTLKIAVTSRNQVKTLTAGVQLSGENWAIAHKVVRARLGSPCGMQM